MLWLVVAFLLVWIAWGPAVLVVAVGLLCVPRVRWWVQDRIWFDRRIATWVTGILAALVVGVLVVPDGWLPIPPAPGVWAAPSYVGRPATARPVTTEPPPNPQLAATGSSARPGPLGLQPEVDTAWLGLQRCSRLEQTSTDVLVALCTDRSGPSLRLVDSESMVPTVSRDLPEVEKRPCPNPFYLDASDRAVVATADRQVLVIPTTPAADEGKGDVDLATESSWDLKPWIPYGDCVVGLGPDWAGRVWWASRDGLVGTITPATGTVEVIDLGEDVRRGLAVDEGGVYVVTDEALHRLGAGEDGVPQTLWRTDNDSSGSAPVLLDGGVVAITDEAKDELGVVFVARDTGERLCRQSVFEKGDGATTSDLAPLGSGVAVVNNHGYSTPRSTLLGFTSNPGIARVDLVDGGCVVSWTSDAVSPSSGATASWPNGLLYAWTKRPSLTGVSAWYLTALDAQSGRMMWGARTGTGLLAGSDGSTITLASDGSAWLGTMAGLVRVRDRS
ncbi:hypothetical protein [Nocardioides hwasunensis]|uniref:PQQ-binding-like beta-propeller repeat protein n=1 Tax=Nocardioides hwasunensis TaxID=397258 RepID=A0ABR8MMV5_9ACTN|nr:hypothetical protein [Nocardioides hwasunensis]MBD3916606.1 hypothetical protein [Nocardioides hwasunensis]